MFLRFSHQADPDLANLSDTNKFKYLLILSAVATSLCVGFKPASQALTTINTEPEALVVLGGHEERERYAAKLALQYPELPIWLSSGSPQAYARRIFANAGVKSDRLKFDYAASDTLTNFTTLVDELEAEGIEHVYLITSENHMKRAKIIGDIVFGSRGIDFEPISVPSENPPESLQKSFRDGARAVFWLVTGRTNPKLLELGKRCLELL
ncbi:MAG: YdcF family protein [Cyanobacteria bacterium J06623_7]